jgi:hypothetical protein
MPGAILPVKRPEADSGLIPRTRRDLVTLRLYENKRQKSGAGFEIETKDHAQRSRSADCKHG